MPPVRFGGMAPVQAVRWPQLSFAGSSRVEFPRPAPRSAAGDRSLPRLQATEHSLAALDQDHQSSSDLQRRPEDGKRPGVEKGIPPNNVPPRSDQPRSEPIGTRTAQRLRA